MTDSNTKWSRAIEAARPQYEALGITDAMEKAVIEHLEAMGALTSCYAPGGGCSSCSGGQDCKKTIRNNCVCVNP